MTVEQCSLFLEAQTEMREEQFKERAILLNGLAYQIVSGIGGIFDKKHKMITLDKLYSAYFGKAAQSKEQPPLSQNQIWLRFLYG